MRAHLVPLLLAVLLCISVPPASAGAGPGNNVGFTLAPALSASWPVTVPSREPVWIELVVTSGMVSDLLVEGPGGLCEEASVSSDAVTPGAPAFRTRIDCGVLYQANYELSVSVLTGAARGYLVLHGMHVNE